MFVSYVWRHIFYHRKFYARHIDFITNGLLRIGISMTLISYTIAFKAKQNKHFCANGRRLMTTNDECHSLMVENLLYKMSHDARINDQKVIHIHFIHTKHLIPDQIALYKPTLPKRRPPTLRKRERWRWTDQMYSNTYVNNMSANEMQWNGNLN